jgi:hypothetical protein
VGVGVRTRMACLAGFALAAIVVMSGQLAAGGAGGGLGGAGRDSLADVRGLPATVDAVLVLKDAARQRRSEAGQALASLLGESGLMSRTAQAWEDLARTLDMEPEAAFDAILGSRVTVVLDGVAPGKAARWAMISEVRAETEERLRKRLRPAPRGLVDGQVVLAVENGRYELATARAAGDGRARLLLAPSGSEALFDAVMPVLAGRMCEHPLGATEAMSKAEAIGAGDVFLIVRVPATRAAADGADAQYIVLSADQRGMGWDARCVASPGALLGSDPGVLPAWSDAVFRGIQTGAMAAVMGPAAQPIPLISAQTPVPAAMVTALLGQAPETVGDRWALVVRDESSKAAPARGLSVTAAIQTKDTAAMATACERLLRAGAGDKGEAAGTTIDRATAEAAKAIPLDTRFAELTRPLLGRDPALSWSCGPRVGSGQAAHSGVQGVAAPASKPGWCTVSIGPGESAPGKSTAAAVADGLAGAEEHGTVRSRVSIGVVRPALLERALRGMNLEQAAAIGGFRHVESIQWDAWRMPDGWAEGTINVRMNRREMPPAADFGG